ncbi:Holliday junction resolvase RuvX [Methylonatrum kenyense]|uniref:Holliday junction resolvase RuvX n=1 Tax=Methylonatrum kenyense TaxID=455253 RepID=UPI00200A4BAC|nr:Holliday junction resolvase RuvX [Methylonatrum kenyense]MCK8516638.1 Holliday junction resolvase RuvX [Methylonatrum kenyense]
MSVETLLGFDFGVRRIGVAVGQTLTGKARPLAVVHCLDRGQPDWSAIDTLIRQWRPQALVVGRPSHADGSDNPTSVASDRFSDRLAERYQLATHRVDERLSSHEAGQRLQELGTRERQKPGAVDMMAACVILETWLAEPSA